MRPAPDEALAEVLLGDDGGGECASLVRSFPNDRDFDDKIYIELRQFCDDSVAGSLYEVSVPLSAGGATRRPSAGAASPQMGSACRQPFMRAKSLDRRPAAIPSKRPWAR